MLTIQSKLLFVCTKYLNIMKPWILPTDIACDSLTDFAIIFLKGNMTGSFGAESVVFQVAIQKLKDQDIQNYNFARGFVWV